MKKLLVLISCFALSGCRTMRTVAREEGYEKGIHDERARTAETLSLYKWNADSWQKEVAKMRQRLQDCLEAGSTEK